MWRITAINKEGSSEIVRGDLSFTEQTGESFSISSNIDFGILHNGLGESGDNQFATTESIADVNILTQENAQTAID